jgi:hypothetical protein
LNDDPLAETSLPLDVKGTGSSELSAASPDKVEVIAEGYSRCPAHSDSFRDAELH